MVPCVEKIGRDGQNSAWQPRAIVQVREAPARLGGGGGGVRR